MKTNYRRIWKWVKIIFVIYVLGGVALFFLQDYILFRPVPLKKDHKYNFSQKHAEVNIPVSENSNLNIVQFLPADSLFKGIVLYFHGNKKNVSWYAKYADHFTKHGYEVWIIDYPGFGKSTGKFSEKNLYDWAGYMYRFARTKANADSIIIYGKSMGTGIAAHLASKEACKKVILETPYYDYPSVIKQYLPIYPVDWIINYQIPTHEYLERVKVPVTILQGTDDMIIWHSNAKRLQNSLKPGDEFVTIEDGEHNNLFDFPQTTARLDSLLTN